MSGIKYPPVVPPLDAIGVLVVVRFLGQQMPPRPFGDSSLSTFLVVSVAIMERHDRRLVYVPIKAVSEFPDPADQLPAFGEREDAGDDEIDGMVMTLPTLPDSVAVPYRPLQSGPVVLVLVSASVVPGPARRASPKPRPRWTPSPRKNRRSICRLYWL